MSKEKRTFYNLVKRTVSYPGWEDCWVEFNDSILVDEIEILDSAKDFATMKEILADYIVDWKMRDVKKEKGWLPKPYRKPEVLGRVPLKILFWCSVALTEAAFRGHPLQKEDDLSASENGKHSSVETLDGLQANSEDK